MSETTYFLNMFSDYEPPEPLKSVLSQAAVVAADIDAETRRVDVCIHTDSYIPKQLLLQTEQEICSSYGLKKFTLMATHPASQLHNMEADALMALFVEKNSMNRGSLAGADWQWEGNTLTIRLAGNGKKELMECVPSVRQYLQERFATSVDIQIEAGQSLSGDELFHAMEKLRDGMLETLPKSEQTATRAAKPAVQTNTIYGKPFKGNPVSMKDISLDMGNVIVEGKVFAITHKELKKRNAWVVNFDMTDNTGSVRVNRFMENSEAKPILEGVKEGSIIKVQGKLTVNNFDNETVLKPNAIMPGSMPKRQDTAEGEKRVELHLHTTMSNMDALTDTAAAVKQAAAWGHRAIAITDHGVAQSFPDAMKAASKAKVAGTDQNIKVLYGCEGYYVNDVDDRIVVHGTQDMDFDEEYVAFDLETTGLSSRTDKIIEIGAVILKNGVEINRFQTFVDPECALERKIVELTGITDDMLKGAPRIDTVLPQFLEFVGNRVLVAHNADFDTGFIRAACSGLGLPYTFTAADTLILSQNLLPHLGKHKLDVVADALSLPEFNHHRAADDAMICGLIMDRLMKNLQERDIHTLQAINPAMVSLRSQNRIGDRHAKHIILFAKNQLGLRNLYHILSDANLKYFKRGVPRIPKSLLMELREGLIIGSACEAGELYKAILEGRSSADIEEIAFTGMDSPQRQQFLQKLSDFYASRG